MNVYDLQTTEELRRSHRLDPHRVREFRNAACKRFEDTETLHSRFEAFQPLSSPTVSLTQRCDSELDGATKLLLRTGDGLLLETVILRIASGRTTLCVSSQVGCAAACDFCATGKMGVAKNLSAAEILDQIRTAGQILAKEGRRIRNVVFMGMGEPFHNEEQLFLAIKCLTSKSFFHFAPSRILVSTVGCADAMVRCVQKFPETNLALSLHSADQSSREKIIPLAKKWPLPMLREAISSANSIQGKPVMIEYLMLAGLNDTSQDAKKLIEWVRGLDVHLNLIPYNPIDDAPKLVASDSDVINAFSQQLKAAGITTTIRYSLGADIAAACGQLVRRENRRLVQLNADK